LLIQVALVTQKNRPQIPREKTSKFTPPSNSITLLKPYQEKWASKSQNELQQEVIIN